MKALAIALAGIGLLVTTIVGFWCGVGSMFVLGDKSGKYHTQGILMVFAAGACVLLMALLTAFIVVQTYKSKPIEEIPEELEREKRD